MKHIYKIVLLVILFPLFIQCSSGFHGPSSSSGGGTVTEGDFGQDSPGSSGGGVSSVGTLTMSSSIGQAVSGGRQTSSSGRFERN